MIISDLNKALYSSSLIGVICKLSIPISERPPHPPEELPGPTATGFPNTGECYCSGVSGTREQACKVCQRGHPEGGRVIRVAHMWSDGPAWETRQPQMDPRSAGLSRATPSVHMLNPSCYLSIRLPSSSSSSSTLLAWLECLMEPRRSSSSVPWLSGKQQKKKKQTSLGGALAHKELCLSDCSEALCS